MKTNKYIFFIWLCLVNTTNTHMYNLPLMNMNVREVYLLLELVMR